MTKPTYQTDTHIYGRASIWLYHLTLPWKTLLKWIYPIGNYSLHSTLNNWLNTGDWLQHWDWYAIKSNIFLYHNLHNRKWERHLLKQYCHHTFDSECLRMEDFPDEPLFRASVQYKSNTIILLNTSLFTDVRIEEEKNMKDLEK